MGTAWNRATFIAEIESEVKSSTPINFVYFICSIHQSMQKKIMNSDTNTNNVMAQFLSDLIQKM